MTVLLVAVGAAVGAPVRLLLSRALPGTRGTLTANVLACLLLGLVVGSSSATYALLGTGFCGTLSTFSAFAVEAVETGQRNRLRGATHVLLTLALCLPAAALGLAL